MAAFTTQSANQILDFILRNVPPAWAGAGTLYLSLHTGTIGLLGNQNTAEVSYPGYARIPVGRDPITGDFTPANAGASENDALLQWGNPTFGGVYPINCTHVALGVGASGPGTVIEFTALNDTLRVDLNIQPQLAVGTLDFTLV